MKNYTHSDASSLWTRTKLVAYVSLFLKRTEAVKLIDLAASMSPALSEEAIFHKKITVFYSNEILLKLDKLSPEFKLGRAIREQEIQNEKDFKKSERRIGFLEFVYGKPIEEILDYAKGESK